MSADKGIFHVLVVEDNPGDFALVKDFLSEKFEAPYLRQAETFAEAKKCLKSGNLHYDLVFWIFRCPIRLGKS